MDFSFDLGESKLISRTEIHVKDSKFKLLRKLPFLRDCTASKPTKRTINYENIEAISIHRLGFDIPLKKSPV